jgi:hypothetical protein
MMEEERCLCHKELCCWLRLYGRTKDNRLPHARIVDLAMRPVLVVLDFLYAKIAKGKFKGTAVAKKA